MPNADNKLSVYMKEFDALRSEIDRRSESQRHIGEYIRGPLQRAVSAACTGADDDSTLLGWEKYHADTYSLSKKMLSTLLVLGLFAVPAGVGLGFSEAESLGGDYLKQVFWWLGLGLISLWSVSWCVVRSRSWFQKRK